MQFVDTDKYKMDFPKVGRCLIINNKHFTRRGCSVREGTDLDAAALEKTFRELRYDVHRQNDLTAGQMMQAVKRESELDHRHYASFICVILSHGDTGVVFGTDGPVQLEALTNYLKGRNCTTLVGKPKLFFIQACRGHNRDSPVEGGNVAHTFHNIPVEADFLYAYATAPGYLSWRDPEKGSWFIQALCDALKKHRRLELLQILTRVSRKVELEYGNIHKEIPCTLTLLTKEFYFP